MDLEVELLKILEKEELEKTIKEKIKSFHGLLTREVAMRLLAKERGLLKEEEKKYRLAEIPKNEKKVGFSVHIKKIWQVAEYSSGKKSRVVEVEDETAVKPLVLWNDDVELVKGLRVRDEITVKGAYERSGELHLGYSGSIVVANKASFSDLAEMEEGEIVHLRGVVSAVEGNDKFIINGKQTPGFSLMISNGKMERRCVIFEGLDRAKKIELDDEIIIEGAIVKNGNVEINADARLLVRRIKNMLIGTVKKMECVGEKLHVEVGERKVTFDRENALRFFNIQIAEDIMLSTITELKEGVILNTKVAIKEKDGQIS